SCSTTGVEKLGRERDRPSITSLKQNRSADDVVRLSVTAPAEDATRYSHALAPSDKLVSPEVATPDTEVAPARKPKLRVHSTFEFTPEQLEYWHHTLAPRVQRLCSKVLKDSPESVGISLLAIGESIKVAKPTVVVTCSSAAKLRG